MSRTRYPWGKPCGNSGETHRLEHHCADVAACFEALLAEPGIKRRFDSAVGGSGLDPTTVARLTVLAFLHDFGKTNVGFQYSVGNHQGAAPAHQGHIKASLYACRRPDVLSALGLPELAELWGQDAVENLLFAALAHHGRPATVPNTSAAGPDNIWRPFAGYAPLVSCRHLFECSRRWFPEAFEKGPMLPAAPVLAHLFAGTVVLADQIGSNENLFPYDSEFDEDYIGRARTQARRAVRTVGVAREQWRSNTSAVGFQDLFEHPRPRPLQTTVAEAPLDCPLLILESETGSGKTEAAVWRFAKLWRAGLVDGLYFALPTRAAAKQLHERVNRALRRVFPPEPGLGVVLAIPGYLKVGEVTGRRVGRFDVEWHDDADEEERLARWSAESARKFLSAPAAVGTVDQALLAGLMVKWAHFRGSALARSLLVVDEVHASDAYMTEILLGVLRGHLRVGGHVLLMSATLGSRARDALAAPVGRGTGATAFAAAERVPYPVLTIAGAGGPPEARLFDSTGYEKEVTMSSVAILEEPARIAGLAVTEARRGAKVLVVRNTVREAQATFDEVRSQGAEALLLQVDGGPALHHSRFAVEDRSLLDDAVEQDLGAGRASGGRVVVGTQTLEQSLDIDADVLLTDLCPVDVLLQRIGRLHRHESTYRAPGFSRPRCLVLIPAGGLESRSFLRYGLGMSRRGGIYRDLRVLELTRRLVAKHAVWILPGMNRMLVEKGTHPERLRALEEELGHSWTDRSIEFDGRAAAERQLARGHVLNREARFCAVSFPPLDELVRTRLGEDGPRIKLSEPATGPFGQPVATFNLPAHLFRSADGLPSKEDIETARAESIPEGLILRVGTYRFRYKRAGLEALDSGQTPMT